MKFAERRKASDLHEFARTSLFDVVSNRTGAMKFVEMAHAISTVCCLKGLLVMAMMRLVSTGSQSMANVASATRLAAGLLRLALQRSLLLMRSLRFSFPLRT